MDGNGPAHGSLAPVSLTSRRPPIERWTVVATVLLVLAVVKPWQSPDDRASAGGPTAPPRRSAEPSVAASPSAADDAALRVAAFCLSTRSWLVATVERTVGHSGDQRIRVWRVIEPATSASGPGDPSIPEVSIVSEGLTELGWCAPVSGDDRPSPPVGMTIWVRAGNGVSRVTLDSSRPEADRTPYGAMYRPPGKGPSSKAASWPDAVYVFRYHEADGRERWFAIDVETRPVSSPAH